MAPALPRRVVITRCRSGTLLMAATSTPTAAIPVLCWPWPGRLMARTLPQRAVIRRCRCGSQGKDQAGAGRGHWSRATARVAPTFLFHPARLFPAKMTMTVHQEHYRHGLPPIYDAYSSRVEEDAKSG